MPRILDHSINELRQEYRDLTGKDFNPDAYPSPKGLSGREREIVCGLKQLPCLQRQMEIISQIRRFERQGDAYVVPADQGLILEEFYVLAQEIKKWA